MSRNCIKSSPENAGVALMFLNDGFCAKVDAAELPLIEDHHWFAHKQGLKYYVAANVMLAPGRRTTVLLHRRLLGATKEQWVDHKNGDTMDNRRQNIRFCTPAQNKMNAKGHANRRSRFKGVHFVKIYANATYQWKNRKPWSARITIAGKRLVLGHFATEELAARAYDAAAMEHFGDFAKLNFSDGIEVREV